MYRYAIVVLCIRCDYYQILIVEPTCYFNIMPERRCAFFNFATILGCFMFQCSCSPANDTFTRSHIDGFHSHKTMCRATETLIAWGSQDSVHAAHACVPCVGMDLVCFLASQFGRHSLAASKNAQARTMWTKGDIFPGKKASRKHQEMAKKSLYTRKRRRIN